MSLGEDSEDKSFNAQATELARRSLIYSFRSEKQAMEMRRRILRASLVDDYDTGNAKHMHVVRSGKYWQLCFVLAESHENCTEYNLVRGFVRGYISALRATKKKRTR